MKPAASETKAPRCPYCGYEMTLATSFNKQTGVPSCRYLCCNCYAESPSTEHVRYAFGLETFEQHEGAAYELAVQRAEMSALEYLQVLLRMERTRPMPEELYVQDKAVCHREYEKAIATVQEWAENHPEGSEEK